MKIEQLTPSLSIFKNIFLIFKEIVIYNIQEMALTEIGNLIYLYPSLIICYSFFLYFNYREVKN